MAGPWHPRPGRSCCGNAPADRAGPGTVRRPAAVAGAAGGADPGRSWPTWPRRWRWAGIAWPTSRCCASSPLGRPGRIGPGGIPAGEVPGGGRAAGARGDLGRAGRCPGAGRGGGRRCRARRRRRPGHRPGRDHRDRAPGEGAGRPNWKNFNIRGGWGWGAELEGCLGGCWSSALWASLVRAPARLIWRPSLRRAILRGASSIRARFSGIEEGGWVGPGAAGAGRGVSGEAGVGATRCRGRLWMLGGRGSCILW